jgi:hypothetical protein
MSYYDFKWLSKMPLMMGLIVTMLFMLLPPISSLAGGCFVSVFNATTMTVLTLTEPAKSNLREVI